MNLDLTALLVILFAVALAAVVPAVAAIVVRVIAGGTLVPAAAFAVLLLIESYAATEILGRVLDRVDLRDVAVPE